MGANIIPGRNGPMRLARMIGSIMYLCVTTSEGFKRSGGITGPVASCGFWPKGIPRQMKYNKLITGVRNEGYKNEPSIYFRDLRAFVSLW